MNEGLARIIPRLDALPPVFPHTPRTAAASPLTAGVPKTGGSADAIYTAGLLHGLGKAVLSALLSGPAGPPREHLRGESAVDFTSRERTLLSLDHAEAGGLLDFDAEFSQARQKLRTISGEEV